METYVVLEVNGTRYAVRSSEVLQVEMIESITPVPRAPEFIEGVASVRGQVVPVISLRKRFHLPPADINMHTRLVVVHVDDRDIGLLADGAHEFIRVAQDQTKALPEDLSGPGYDYLESVIVFHNRLMLVINLPALINSDERAVLKDAKITKGE